MSSMSDYVVRHGVLQINLTKLACVNGPLQWLYSGSCVLSAECGPVWRINHVP